MRAPLIGRAGPRRYNAAVNFGSTSYKSPTIPYDRISAVDQLGAA